MPTVDFFVRADAINLRRKTVGNMSSYESGCIGLLLSVDSSAITIFNAKSTKQNCNCKVAFFLLIFLLTFLLLGKSQSVK